MKKLILLCIFISSSLMGAVSLQQIQTSYEKAKKEFEVQKQDQNITKLLAISKQLYENNEKLKELKEKFISKVTLEFTKKKKIYQVDEPIELVATTKHQKNTFYEKSTLTFEVFEGTKSLIKKPVELRESDATHKESLKFKLKNPSQEYRVCVTFEEATKRYKECKALHVEQLLLAKELIVSTNLDATKSDEKLFEESDLYLFLPFKNLTDKPLEGKVLLREMGASKILLEQSFSKEPTKEFKKAGLKIPKSFIKAGKEFYASIELFAEGVNRVKKEKHFQISNYAVKLYFPKNLNTSKAKAFRIQVPKEFEEPLHVSLKPRGGISIGSKDNLKGTISALTKKKTKAFIDVKIEDAKNRSFQSRVAIALNGDIQKSSDTLSKKTYTNNQKSTSSKKSSAVGSMKEISCARLSSVLRNYSGTCIGVYDGRFYKPKDQRFTLYSRFDEKDLSIYRDVWEKKGSLVVKGSFKNGKVNGKFVKYFPNGKVASISYYKDGKRLEFPTKRYFANGRLNLKKEKQGKKEQTVVYTKDGTLDRYFERSGKRFINYRSNRLKVSDANGELACEAEFYKGKTLSALACFYTKRMAPNASRKKRVGVQTAASYQNTKFYPLQNTHSCTNRPSRNGTIDWCKNNEERYYMQRIKAFADTLAIIDGKDYIGNLDFENIKNIWGQSFYYNAFNNIVKENIYVQSNLSKSCKDWQRVVAREFIRYHGDLRNKASFYKKAMNKSNTHNISMIMKDFAKKHFAKANKAHKCYSEVRRFYRHQGWLR